MKNLLATLSILAAVSADLRSINTCYNDPASLQLPEYKLHKKTVDTLTSLSGAPIEKRDMEVINSDDLMEQQNFVENVASVVRERIPERTVHTKGAGAFGYFVVTNDTISKYCKADFLSELGKKTRLFVRFSRSSGEKGEADTVMDIVGTALKFYTREGNFDLTLFTTPCFAYREPSLFMALGRCIKKNPVTNIRDPHMLFDHITSSPQTFPMFFLLFSDIGILDGFRHMNGHSLHTYQVYNSKGESFFWRWKLTPKCGIKYLHLDEATEIACTDPDYAVRDLFNEIKKRNFPRYDFGVQLLTLEQVKKCPFDVFDLTRILPEKDYPVWKLGEIVLDRNPINFFTEVEQAAFCPSNRVPGILGAPDKAFISRGFAYKDAQRYRLGRNFESIPVNRPLRKVNTYNRDGRPPIPGSDLNGPNYYPNSYGGPVPYEDKNRPRLIKIRQRDRSHDFSQVADVVKTMTSEEKNRMAMNMRAYLVRVNEEMQNRFLDLVALVSTDMVYRVKVLLAASTKICHSS